MRESGGIDNHGTFYSKAHLYEIAFQFKDTASENSTLISLYEGLHGRKPASFLDIAAGPATNAIQMYEAHQIAASALDYSEDMVDYGRSNAARRGIPLNYHHGDMRSFSLPSSVDIAAMFMASTGYLRSNDDMVRHLRAVATNLSRGGVYLLEMTHPRDVFGVGSSTSQEWEEVRNGCTVNVKWGVPEDPFDPIEQVRHVTAQLTYKTAVDSGVILDQCTQREFSFQEMKALVELSGVFDWVTTLGAWDINVPFSNEPRSWRMMPVLRKRD